jgi:Right handed beta helix region
MTRFVVPLGPSTLLRPRVRTVVSIAAALWLLSSAVSEAHAAPRRAADGTVCARYASPSGSDARSGSASRPFRTVQRLANALRAGQTGCLLRGTYVGNVIIAADRVKLASVARARARLRGYIWIKDSANGVTLSHLSIDGHNVGPITVQVQGDGALLRRLNITNRNKRNSSNTGSCVLLGVVGAPAVRPQVVRSRIHNCGGGNGGHDHAIYTEFTRRALIRNNYLYDNPGFGISMYPDTQNALIEHNVIDGNGYENRGNVTFSGEEAGGEYDRDYASSYNILRRNIISNAWARYNIDSYFPSLQPRGNLVSRNCVWNAPFGNFGGRSGYALALNRIAPPSFRNRAAKDFRLRAVSRCRGKGPTVWPIG